MRTQSMLVSLFAVFTFMLLVACERAPSSMAGAPSPSNDFGLSASEFAEKTAAAERGGMSRR
jgi:hypothetical protein